jgi:hypothetical protein
MRRALLQSYGASRGWSGRDPKLLHLALNERHRRRKTTEGYRSRSLRILNDLVLL